MTATSPHPHRSHTTKFGFSAGDESKPKKPKIEVAK
jgi:hypothetical protein